MPPAGPIRPARDHELPLLGQQYRRSNFSSSMAEVARFARDMLGGEIFVAERDGEPVGASACAHFGTSGWVGGVAVLPERRGGGLGGALTQAAVERLLQLGVSTVMLYATEMGRPIYERLGFAAEGECVTLESTAAPADTALPAGARPARGDDLDAALALDRHATGEDRAGLLAAFWPKRSMVVGSDGGLRGYFLSSPWRPGGAIVARDLEAGLALVAAARRHTGGELFLSVPDGNQPVLRALTAAGHREQSRATRMRLGPPLQWHPQALFSTFNLFWG